MTPQEFYSQFLPYARSVSERTGVDPRLVLAQAALETGYGKSAPNMNFFGIKSHGRKGGQTLQTSEFQNGQMVQQPASFRAYETPEQSFQDYADFLMSNPRYEGVRSAQGLQQQIEAMGKSGYATDPQYAAKLASIASKFDPSSADIIAADTMTALGKQPKGILAPQATDDTESRTMTPQDEPRGLLGSLGIQRMEEGAAGETGQRFYERDTFKDTAATLAQGFAAMGSMPGLQKLASDVAAQRSEGRARNKTVEYLRKNGRGDLADMVEKGLIGAGAAAAEMLKKPGAVKGVAVGDRLVNPVTGEVIYEDTSAPEFDPKDVVAARKEFSSLPPVKQFSDQTSAYGRVVASVNDPSPSGDLALIFNFMKVLDPGSVVREGEFATAQNAGGIDQRTRSLYNRITSGERLTPEQRADFADRATRLYSEAQSQYQSIAEQYAGFAEQAGLPVDQVIPDFSYSKDLYTKPLEFSRPPAPAGVDPADWATAWSNMTDAQRQEFIDGGAN